MGSLKHGTTLNPGHYFNCPNLMYSTFSRLKVPFSAYQMVTMGPRYSMRDAVAVPSEPSLACTVATARFGKDYHLQASYTDTI